MELGYYWAHHTKDNAWRIVEVVARLPEHVLDSGYAWPRSAYSEFDGPLRRDHERSQSEPPSDGEICGPRRGVVEDVEDMRKERDYLAAKLRVTEVDLCRFIDDLKAKLEAAHAELHDLRIRVGLGTEATHD